MEPLERRTFLNATLVQPLAAVTGGSSSSTTIDLSPSFADPSITGTTVEVQTPVGNIPIMLFDSQTPQTVANFEHYISSGEYNNVIFHRSVPGFVLQGGGYTTGGTHITQFAAVPGEPGVSNTTGTIAMALSSGPNSGTSEWFVNLTDNNGTGATNLDDSSDGGPFTAFGRVIYNGMSVVNAIVALPRVNLKSSIPAWSDLPVLTNNSSITASDLVTAKTVNVGALSYSATSDNTSLVNPTVSGNNLVLNYGAGAGTANVTVTATDLGGNTAVSTFAVNVIPQVTVGNARGEQHVVRFTDPNGVPATMTLGGPGTATVTLQGTGLSISTTKAGIATISGTPTSVAITTNGTSAASTLNVTGAPTIASIAAGGDLGAVNAPRVALDGSLSVPGSIGRITLGSASGGAIAVSGAARPLTLSVGPVSNEAIVSAEAIASFTVGSISGLNLSASSIGRITDRGDASGLVVNSTGSITALSALSLTGSRIEAGNPTLDANGIPTAFPTSATISTVTIGRGGFSNSIIGAATLGRLALGAIASANGGMPFGVAAHEILALTATVDGKRLSLARVTSADQVSAALTKGGITPNDLVIRIV